ncbi:MAG: NAD-dependent epimerase/dehydratase family protein, partial [Pseudoxanthomonas sp.]|nr:NAD-dependent epimerase/dehydratase family protein [Pseudoxanthomonas sp.]
MNSADGRIAFVAGATGAVGQVLCRLLLEDGWQVHGTTRSEEKAARLRALVIAEFGVPWLRL